MNPGGGAGGDESPLGVQIPDDARELERDVLAYHRELRARRRRSRLRRLVGPLAGNGTIMPVLASIMAVCLVAGAMLSVATFGPTTAPADRTHPPTGAASTPVTPRASAIPSVTARHPTAAGTASAQATAGTASAQATAGTASAQALRRRRTPRPVTDPKTPR